MPIPRRNGRRGLSWRERGYDMSEYLGLSIAAETMGMTRQSLYLAVQQGRIEPAIVYRRSWRKERAHGYLFDRAAAEAIGAERRKRGRFGVKYGPRKRA